MKRTKRAMAKVARSSPLISVLGGRGGALESLQLAVALAMLFTTTTAAHGQEYDGEAARSHVMKATGKDAIDCGTFEGSPYASGRWLPSDKAGAVSTCINTAWASRRIFFFAVEGSAIDSWVVTGLLSTPAGELRVFWYDSAPCGGPHCRDWFEMYACPTVTATERVELYMKCGDTKLPQPRRPTRR